MPAPTKPTLRPLAGQRILSLSLNLPGPAALMRLRAMGARCVKLAPPGLGDPMQAYCPQAYAAMHVGVRTVVADLKTPAGQKRLHAELAKTDVLLTSFRPSALSKLGLSWKELQRQYPRLTQVAIVGAAGARAEEPGHDLTYLAENGLVTGLDLPPSLYADMGGSLLVTEAVLQAVAHQQQQRLKGRDPAKLKGMYLEVALADAAAYLALPRVWGLTQAGADVGGGHAGYRVYACKDGRVALAALEPHFAARLCTAVGLPVPPSAALAGQHMRAAASHEAVQRWAQSLTRRQLDQIGSAQDIPLLTLPKLG